MGTIRKRKDRNVYSVRYTDADGIRREVSTSCKTREGARQVLADLESDVERIKSGVVSREEADMREWDAVPLSEHIEAHEQYMKGLNRADTTIKRQRQLMTRISAANNWKRLRDLNRPQFERWLGMLVSEGTSARVRNAFLVAAKCFANWAVKAGRMPANPFGPISRMNERIDRRHVRRVLSPAELADLCAAIEGRPEGAVRALVYRTLFYTGLRYSELRRVGIGDLRLDCETPHIELLAAHEKAGRGALVPIPAALAKELSEYLTERRARLLGQPGAKVVKFQSAPDTALLFDLPASLIHTFDRDLKAAGIAKVDSEGRLLDVHALRHSYCTMIAQSGANMQTAMKLMRHSTPAMTARYTHMNLRDLGGAVASLPTLPTAHESKAALASNEAVDLRPLQRPHSGRNVVQNGATSCTMDTPEVIRGKGQEIGENIRKYSDSRGVMDGGPRRSRTCDLVIKSHLLYQLS